MTMFARPATLEAVEATATDSNTLDALAALIDFGWYVVSNSGMVSCASSYRRQYLSTRQLRPNSHRM